MNYSHFIIPKNIQKDLDNFKDKIIVRFPPEPSGYLHMGHVKALYINACVAKKYNGELKIRMDDTNPSLESEEYENAILEDLKVLNINVDNITFASNYFDILIQYAEILIKDGHAYVDLNDSEKIKEDRKKGIDSIYRENNVDKNYEYWNDLKKGNITGCLRIKTDMNHKNYAMRDFTLFRPININHFKTKDKYKVYPTYDFSCPIIDSIEGITHVFRSCEYNERDEQNELILNLLNLRKPNLYHYGKLLIENAELSKRKIKEGIIKGKYKGWDDPRLYTLRGLIKRGMCFEALEEIMKDTGYFLSDAEISEIKIWSINKKYIDKISTRYMAINKKNTTLIHINMKNEDYFDFNYVKEVDKFVRNENLGKRKLFFSKDILLDKEDIKLLTNNEEITLLNFMNVTYSNNIYMSNTNGSYKTTKNKLVWVPYDEKKTVNLKIVSYQNNKENIEEYYGEYDMKNIKIGDYIQIIKKNYYKCINQSDHLIEFIECSC